MAHHLVCTITFFAYWLKLALLPTFSVLHEKPTFWQHAKSMTDVAHLAKNRFLEKRC